MAFDLALRPFRPDDLPILHRIREAAFAPVFASFRALVGAEIASIALADAEAEQGRHLEEIAAGASGHRLLVVEAGGAVAGFVSFRVDPARRGGEIGLNAVHPDFAGRGVGTWMYGEALARMKALGAEVAEVGTGGDSSHAAARRAYEKAGFGPAIPALHLYRRL
ncbi:MAG TPA: GNAT family N-acetyltransferase [Allosphingosinicella sp.]|nr:GNAT family N-acetyltransferase [Allosphingosinicella sp.]